MQLVFPIPFPFYLERIGRRFKESGAARSCPVLSKRCCCNALSTECSEAQHGCVSVLDDERFLSSAGDPQSEPDWVDAPDEGLAHGFASCRVDASFRESLRCCLRVEYS
jgi:hypothetical protein